MKHFTSRAMQLAIVVLAALGGRRAEDTPEKIVIHIPYKIQHHHHTHTNYKVLTVPKERDDPTTQKDIETVTEVAATPAETTSVISSYKSPYEAPKVRTIVRVKETSSVPLLEYFGINKLFGGEQKPTIKPGKLEIIHDDPVVEHLVHGPWKAPVKFQPELEEQPAYSQAFSYGGGQYQGEYNGQYGEAHELPTSGDDNFGKFSAHKPVYQTIQTDSRTPSKSTGYQIHEPMEQSKMVSDAVQQVFQKHLYKDFPELKKGRYLKHVGKKPMTVTMANGKSLSLAPIKLGQDTSNYEQIGYIVVDHENNHKFVGMDGKEVTTR